LSGAVQIVGTEGEAIRVRRAPDARAEARDFLAHGTRVEILDGPVQAADGAWYLVAYDEGELPGWVPADALGPPGAAPRSRGAAPRGTQVGGGGARPAQQPGRARGGPATLGLRRRSPERHQPAPVPGGSGPSRLRARAAAAAGGLARPALRAGGGLSPGRPRW